ncbi:MAG: YkgJ family cysteine cluster protein [Candidatus Helarchaeota archaeon]|nr:YkgJ family cysteine cluster protein [Candidatus Helarchaeota archaeon]
MLLSNDDVRRIRKRTDLARQKFSYLKEGYLYLKNKENSCVFLNDETKRCSIYEARPTGCRFYPIIYDPYSRECIVDKDCSNKENVPIKKVETTCPSLEEFILLLEKERNERLTLSEKVTKKTF